MLMALRLPRDLAITLWIPAASRQARTAPPALTPVPGAAGRRMTCAVPDFATIACGIVAPIIGTGNIFFRADSSALRIASGIPRALPRPTPTEPLLSPTTTRIDQLAVLPPLWVLNTLLV